MPERSKMNLSEADLGKIFWRTLAGSASAAGDNMPRFASLPLDVRGCMTQTAVDIYDSGDELRGETLCTRLRKNGWTSDRYDETVKTIAFAQPQGNISFGIAIMLRAASCAIIAMKEI
jgi:hypothetical protein